MSVIPLAAERRSTLGKGGARKARAAGRIPAVLYGHGETPMAIAVTVKTFDEAMRHHRGGNPIVNLALEGGEYTALVRDVQRDPLSHLIVHLDFQHISLTEEVEVQVSLHLTGLPVGVKDGGGILEHIVRSIEVRCLPTAIPPSVDADVSALGIGDSLHVRDLKVEGVVILSDPNATIATVVPPTVMEEKPAEEVAAAAATTAAEPELSVAKGKKEDEEGAEKEKEKEKK